MTATLRQLIERMRFPLLWFSALLTFGMPAAAHQDDHPSQSASTHSVFVDMHMVKRLGLAEPPRRDALFKLTLIETGAVGSCTPRFQKKDSSIGAAMCSRLQQAISWEQDLRKDQKKLASKQSIKLAWPKRGSRAYLSDFGGALPINMNDWIHNSEIHTLNGYDTGETDFEIELEISERGRARSCSVSKDSIAKEFQTLLCDQIMSHSHWIPKVDQTGNRVLAQAVISARLIMSSRGCRRSLAIGMDQRRGRMEISSGPRNIACGSFNF